MYIDKDLPFDEKKKLVLSLKDRTTLYTTKCECCGEEFTNKRFSFEMRPSFLCRECKRKKTSIERYGEEHPMKSKEIKDKLEQVCMEKYGVRNFYQTEENTRKRLEKLHSEEHKQLIRDIAANRTDEDWVRIYKKRKETCMEKYGTENIAELESVRNKYRNTCMEKYGVDNYFKTKHCKEISSNWASSKEFRDKVESTMMERYGTTILMDVEEFRKRQQQTMLEKYGGAAPAKSKEVVEKMKMTCIEKYGENYIHAIRTTSFRNIDNIYFDSSWEYAFWKYHKDKNIEIKREPVAFEYFDNEKRKTYIPDFEVEGKLYEIKGDQFFNDKGELINPYDGGKVNYEKMKCMKNVGVIVLKRNDIQKYLDYMVETYGKNWRDIYYTNTK